MIRRELFSDEPKKVDADDIYRICIETKQDIEDSKKLMMNRFDQLDNSLLDLRGSIREMQATIINKINTMIGLRDTITKVIIIILMIMVIIVVFTRV